MIISKISGGLGNQMFQYAFGKHLSIRNDSELKLDLRFYDNPQENREFQLDILNLHYAKINSESAKAIEAHGREYDPKKVGLLTRLQNLFNPTMYKIIKQKDRKFYPEFLDLKGNILLDGYWVSEKYFITIQDKIRNIFSVKTPVNKDNQEMLEKIRSTESVCVHIRRGDYVSNERANKHHGTCSKGYYEKSASIYKDKIKNPVFFVFSDDIEWCKKNIHLSKKMIYVDNNSLETGYEDLRLMYNCKYFIIANSTFSWWGAWLSSYNEKKVIAPKSWFAKKGLYEKDIVPDDWIRV